MSFADGQCVGYLETFIAGDGAAGAYVCHLVITASRLELTAGGPLREMCTAAARDYPYVPPVAKQTAAPSKQFAKMGSGVKAGNPINPARLELWRQYLEKRGVQFLIGTPEAELKLYDNQADGLYSAGSLKKTIYLHEPPGTATFFEEAFHALQHLRNHPAIKVLAGGQEVDAWEYDAKQALLKHSEKLGLS